MAPFIMFAPINILTYYKGKTYSYELRIQFLDTDFFLFHALETTFTPFY